MTAAANIATMELDRRFSECTENNKPSEFFEFFGVAHGSMGWTELLLRRRVVILAEAGSGKSTEFKLQADSVARGGTFSFLSTVRDAAERGFEPSLAASKRSELARWRESDESAWFFMDSVDEAKARGFELSRALKSLAEAMEGCERRAHIFLSGRPSDWEFRRDLGLFAELLPIPEDQPPQEAIDPSVLVVDIIRGATLRRPKASEQPLVAVMLALDNARVAKFAAAKGIASIGSFLEALERHGLSRFARRPLDLQWLVVHWRADGRFGTLREMLALSVNERLKEPNPSMARIDELAIDDSNAALDRIGAALVLQRVDSILVPDADMDGAATRDALDLADVLPEWSAARRAKLIGRAAFPPSRGGFVRLHNDNEGVVRGFLAARWLASLLAAHCPRSKVFEILIADIYGRRVVKPSMAETAAWLSIADSAVASEVLSRDPWLLLERGDPASLPLEVRSRALRAAMTAPDAQRFGRLGNLGALRRLVQGDMADTVRGLWAEFNQDEPSRQLLLQLIWLGSLTSCADIAAQASFGTHADRTSQILSARAMIACGSDADKIRYASHLVDQRAAIDSEVFWDGVSELFPRWLGVDELAGALADRAVRAKSSARDLSRAIKSLVEQIQTEEAAERLLSSVLHIVRSEPSEDGHPLLDMAEACASRLVALGAARAAPPSLAVNALIEIARATTRIHTRDTQGLEQLKSDLTSAPGGKRAALWAAADCLGSSAQLFGRPMISPFQLDFFRLGLAFDVDDAEWLIEDAANRERDTDAQLAVNAAMQIWRDNGQPAAILAPLEKIAEARQLVAETLAAWTNPPPAPPAESAILDEMRAMNERHAEKAAASDASWRSFVENLRAAPGQLRSCRAPEREGVDARLLHLWQLTEKLRGGQSRYSDADPSSLTPLLGEAVVAEFSAALRQQWRLWSPTPKVDRPEETKNTLNAADLLGLMGVSVEARSNPSWAERLSDAEARAAAFYATLENDGLPDWISALAEAKPGAVREALLHCCFGEWAREDSSPFQGALDDLARAGDSVCSLVAPAIFERLRAAPPPSVRILKAAIAILRQGLDDAEGFGSAMLALFREEADVDKRVLYLEAAFATNAASASAALDEVMAATGGAERKALAQAAMPRIFGGDWAPPSVDVDAMPTSILRRLVDVAHREIPSEEDRPRSDGEVYSPNARDHAASARSAGLTALVRRPGLATFEAIQSMIESDFPTERIVLEKWAHDRAAEDSETAPWSSTEVASFEKDFTALPRTPKDLQTVALNRIDDLQRHLNDDDFNQGATVASLPNERAVQNWFANEFRRDQGMSFSIEREPHVADEKEPDLRLQAKGSSARLPIEIKVAESWSLRELEEALSVQLMGRYLRDAQNNWGILLLVHQDPRARGWEDGQAGFMSIQQVASHLRNVARELGAKDSNAPQMAVALVDVSASAPPPKKTT